MLIAVKVSIALVSLIALGLNTQQTSTIPTVANIAAMVNVPDIDSRSFLVWASCLAVSSLISTIGAPLLYYLTYRTVTKQFHHSNSMNSRVDRLAFVLERTVLQNTVILSATLCICYLPQALFTVLVAARVTMPIWIGYACILLIGLDGIIAPIQIVYFNQNLKVEVERIVRWKSSSDIELN
ncbi:hypothetical protein BC830DRAFT_816421 [Chytriomyces sp. MP71]|nr:hypothetical protein BC830DRAFT_816421 [Chytriomyces sp. MP71]